MTKKKDDSSRESERTHHRQAVRDCPMRMGTHTGSANVIGDLRFAERFDWTKLSSKRTLKVGLKHV